MPSLIKNAPYFTPFVQNEVSANIAFHSSMEGQSCSTEQGKQSNCGWDKKEKVWQQEVDFKEQRELERRFHPACNPLSIKCHFLPETNSHLQNAELISVIIKC